MIEDLLSHEIQRYNAAWQQLSDNTLPMVLQWVRLRGGDNDEGADIHQESLIICLEKLRTGGFDRKSKVETFVIGIAKFKWQEKHRNNKKRVLVDDDFLAEVPEVDPGAPFYSPEEVNWVKGALHRLDKKCKLALELFYYKQLSLKEAAAEMKFKTVQSFKNRKQKCIDKLKRMLNKHV